MNAAYPYHVNDGCLADLETALLSRVKRALSQTENPNEGAAHHAAHAAIVRDLCAAMASIRSMRAATPAETAP